MEFDTILYDVDDRVCTITFNRPDQLNAVSPAMAAELRRAYAAAEADDSVWTIIVTGNGRAFCAGADVTEIPEDGRVIYEEPYLSTYPQWEAPQEATPPVPHHDEADHHRGQRLVLRRRARPCDLSATSRSRPNGPSSSTPTSASDWCRAGRWSGWPGYCPSNVAMRVALTGRHERMGAQRAYDLGMVSRGSGARPTRGAHPRDGRSRQPQAPLAVRGTRLAIRKGIDLPLHEAEILAEAFRERVVRTDDAKEGPTGVRREAAPKWSGTMTSRPSRRSATRRRPITSPPSP